MLTYEAMGDVFLNFINAILYAFWFGVLVFVVFILYMTIITIKLNQKKEKKKERKEMYKKYYQSILYSIPLIVAIFISFALGI